MNTERTQLIGLLRLIDTVPLADELGDADEMVGTTRLALQEVRHMNPDRYRPVSYAGEVMSAAEADLRMMRDNHMALRNLARELLDAHGGDGDPRWPKLRALLGE